MTLGELFEETYIQGEIAIRSYDSTGTTIEHYLGDAEDETIRLVRLVADSEEGIMDDVFRLEYGSCEFKI